VPRSIGITAPVMNAREGRNRVLAAQVRHGGYRQSPPRRLGESLSDVATMTRWQLENVRGPRQAATR